MRTLKKNKQKMFYSLYVGRETIYKLDADGNKIVSFIGDDGTIYYEDEGTTEPHYAEPVEFRACITSQLNELHARAYGVDQSSIYSYIVCKKGYLPLEYGTKIWRTSEIAWDDEENRYPNADSADYTVVGLMDEGLYEDCYLLQRTNTMSE